MLDGPATAAPTPAGSPPPGAAAPPNRRLRIVLAYLWLLALVPFLAEKDDPEVRWHARHGLLLFGAEMAVFFLMSALGPISGLLERLGQILALDTLDVLFQDEPRLGQPFRPLGRTVGRGKVHLAVLGWAL